MGRDTHIEWCHHTFNPWIGCTPVSAGCKNCYAEALMDKRYGRVRWGKGNPRQRTSAANWRQPIKWDRDAAKAGERRRVFCASLADVFDYEVTDLWREDLFRLIYETTYLDWLLLTKRPQKMRDWLKRWTWVFRGPDVSPLPNVWLGVSVENQEMADARIPTLFSIPAAVRFVSYEPALGPVDWRSAFAGHRPEHDCASGFCTERQHEGVRHINWIIVGGESGSGARPFDLAWARSTIRQCRDAGVACFVKQLGKVPIWDGCGLIADNPKCPTYKDAIGRREVHVLKTVDGKGGDPTEWPEDLRVREFPENAAMIRDAKRGQGRLFA